MATTLTRGDRELLTADAVSFDGSWLGVHVLGMVVIAGAAVVLPVTAFYGASVLLVAPGVWQFLGLTHVDDRLGRGLGVLLTLGHSATIWFFEHDPRVLVPAQSLLPLSALFFTLLRPSDVASAGRRATGVAFGPLWIGLLTYLAVACRAAGEHGAALATLAVLSATLANVGAWISARLFVRQQSSLLALPRLLADAGCAIALCILGGAVMAASAPHALPLLDALTFGAVAGGLARVGRLGQAALETSFRGPSAPALPKHWLPDHLSALLLTSALAYGYVQLRPLLLG